MVIWSSGCEKILVYLLRIVLGKFLDAIALNGLDDAPVIPYPAYFGLFSQSLSCVCTA